MFILVRIDDIRTQPLAQLAASKVEAVITEPDGRTLVRMDSGVVYTVLNTSAEVLCQEIKDTINRERTNW